MAGQPVQIGDQEYTFGNVQLLKNETLGTGSYGTVCKAKCDQLMCAAKLIWPDLLQMQALELGKEHRRPLSRFEWECELLSRINHPNIVQYLGTYHDPETNAPVLLMELMDESLTHYLESSAGVIHHHIQVNLASDIAQALAFLHANGIIHRDLSSNNVLLIAGGRAKVSDFGMSKFTNRTRLATMTKCPGTSAFMSPEALDEHPVYSEKIDTFSFGVVLVQIVTRQFPEPRDRFETTQILDPKNSTRSVEALIRVPEVERRQAHIGLIEPTHPLLPIALDCLKDEEVERPSSQQLCQSLEAVKGTARYEDSLHQDPVQLVRVKDGQIREKDEQIQARDEQLQTKDEELQARENDLISAIDEFTLRLERSTQNSLALEHEVADRETQLRRLNQQLEANEEITARLHQTIDQRDREMSEMREILSSKGDGHSSETTARNERQQEVARATPATKSPLSMVWRSQPDCPHLIECASSAVIGDKAYYRVRWNLYEFDSSRKKWEEKQPSSLQDPAIVSIDNTLTSVGGWYENWLGSFKPSNKLCNYIDNKWVEHFPPMPTKREVTTAVYTNSTLIVAGGRNDYEQPITAVEILNTRSKRWSKVSPLPFPTYSPSMAICGEYVYLHPGETPNEYQQERNSVIKCSVLALVQSDPKSNVWERLTSLPVFFSTLVTFNGHLLAVGGVDSWKHATKDVYQYDSGTNSWQLVSQMLHARYECCAVVLPTNELMVVGGKPNGHSVEIASCR